MPPSRVVTWFHSVVRGYGQGNLDEGVLVVQKDATRDGFDVWIGAVVHDAAAGPLSATVTVAERRVEVVLQHYVLDEGQVAGVPAHARFFHNHATVEGLAPGASYPVTVEVAGHGTAACHARTLPAALPTDRPLRIFTASCYDVGTDPDDKLQAAYGTVFPAPPDLSLLVGDQVYADAPFSHYWLRSRTNPRAGLLLKYWMTWGMSRTRPRRGLHGVLTTGPNYFLPDDHEFWNNWPNQSATAKDSYARIGTALLDAWKRRWAVVPDHAVVTREPPADPDAPPTDAVEQSYFPTHPAERDRWSLASFELFGAFQTRSRADRLGEPARGVGDCMRIGPPAPDGPLVNPPRNVIVQTVEIDPVTICLLDTRTRRTRRQRHPVLSGFVDEVYLDEMLAHARRAAIFVLATPQPLLRPAGWRTEQGTRGAFRHVRRRRDVGLLAPVGAPLGRAGRGARRQADDHGRRRHPPELRRVRARAEPGGGRRLADVAGVGREPAADSAAAPAAAFVRLQRRPRVRRVGRRRRGSAAAACGPVHLAGSVGRVPAAERRQLREPVVATDRRRRRHRRDRALRPGPGRARPICGTRGRRPLCARPRRWGRGRALMAWTGGRHQPGLLCASLV
jgi:hypothetical protein